MSPNKKQVVSAQVVLRSASGKPSGGRITAEALQEYLPSPEVVTRATKAFASMGFDVGGVVGISFSIAASPSTFETTFRTTLRYTKERGIESVNEDGTVTYELPLQALPKSLVELLVAVTFTPPPDFGPGNFGPCYLCSIT